MPQNSAFPPHRAPAPPSPSGGPLKPLDWFIRTMAEDLAQLKAGEKPQEKPLVVKAPEPAQPPPTPAPPVKPPPPVLPVPSPSAPPKPSPPRPKIPSPLQPAPSIPRPPALAKPTLLESFRRYVLQALVGVVTLGVASVLAWTVLKRAEPEPTPTPLTKEPMIEGEVVGETSPPATPTPSPRVLAYDAEEVVTATAENLLAVLGSIATKPRPPATLTKLIFPGLGAQEISRVFASIPPELIPTSTAPAVEINFWTQQEVFATSTHLSRLVVLVPNVPSALSESLPTLENTLLRAKETLWLGIQGSAQATPAFQDNVYRETSIRYLNFPLPDLTIDYAFFEPQNVFVLATSREAMYGVIERIQRAGK